MTINSPYATLIIPPTPRMRDKPTDTNDVKEPSDKVAITKWINAVTLTTLATPRS